MKYCTFAVMMKLNNIHKLAFVILLVIGMQVAYAALTFTGLADEKNKNNSKFSLKSLSSLSHKSLSFSSLKSSLQYKGGVNFASPKETGNGLEVSSMLRYDNGNTTYIYPYKYKIKSPRFKTPSRN